MQLDNQIFDLIQEEKERQLKRFGVNRFRKLCK